MFFVPKEAACETPQASECEPGRRQRNGQKERGMTPPDSPLRLRASMEPRQA
jgi:hypothetical protein